MGRGSVKVAILSDIHANIFALDAVYVDLDRVGVDHILVAGDLVGYYYWPADVVSRLASDERVRCIRGNHEDILEVCMADTQEAIRYAAKYGSGYACCIETMTPSMLAWLATLPANLDLTISGVTFHLSHGALGSTNTYIYPNAALNVLNDNISDCDVTIFGHTHHPFVYYRGEQILLNPGSVGQPRDQCGTASYIILNLENLVIQPRRVMFDVTPVIAAAQARDPELAYLWKIMQR